MDLNASAIFSLLSDEQKDELNSTREDMIGVAFANVAGAALLFRALGEYETGNKIFELAEVLTKLYPFLGEI